MKAPLVYLLDSNVLIQAKNQYYAFSICPGFWESLLGHHNAGAIYSIVQVRQELEIGGDELADWAAHTAPATFFLATHHVDVIARYQEIMTWLQRSAQFYDLAKADFAAKADRWIVAYASVMGHVLVTQETLRPEVRNRVPIPNVCEAFGVDVASTFEMLKALNVQFTWDSSGPESS